jgi:uncharacterized protein (DUF427 family)
MATATWHGIVLAESDDTVVVEGNHYFPRAALRPEVVRDVLKDSDVHTQCPWKGEASYYDLEHGDARTAAAVWYYPEPKPGAEMVRDRVAFWKDVAVTG